MNNQKSLNDLADEIIARYESIERSIDRLATRLDENLAACLKLIETNPLANSPTARHCK